MLKRNIAGWMIAVAGVLAASVAVAENLAVIISNGVYDNYPRVRDARAINLLESEFKDAGFEVVISRNRESLIPEDTAANLWNRMSSADRLVVVLSGHFVRTDRTNWLLMPDANRPSAFTVGAVGFPLAAVMEIAATKQGAAVVAVAVDDTEVERGPGTLAHQFSRNVPQGVTFIQGAQKDVADFIVGEVLQPGRILADAAQQAPRGLRIEGYLPTNQSFLPRDFRLDIAAADRAFWQQVRGLDTAQAYESYLGRYPNGLFAADATRRIQDLRVTPEDRAQGIEGRLNLTLDQRQGIQRNLSLLGFDTGGIDGIFGRRTRQGIASWQRQVDLPPYGYLTANQITRISNAAAKRAAELAREAERRRIESERLDQQYWNQTGVRQTEEGYRLYLERYEDGLFSDEARARLADIERERRRLVSRQEREDWNRTEILGSLDAYQAYLRAYPDGRFAAEAHARIQRLTRPETPPDVIDAARREEEGLNLNGLTRSLIEGQLNNLGFQPGAVDGKFDKHTRRALRRYQRNNDMPVTGFVSRAIIIRLLASAVQ